jgi:hypothetical protein
MRALAFEEIGRSNDTDALSAEVRNRHESRLGPSLPCALLYAEQTYDCKYRHLSAATECSHVSSDRELDTDYSVLHASEIDIDDY